MFEDLYQPESENISVGTNRLITVQLNHSLMDPIEGDPVLSAQFSDRIEATIFDSEGE